ncbi:hypothetical protein [Thalassospira sp. UBA1131]|jgi:hypothetical protein|uniref:hypothetical protein n=1 Tax=Thalassospira sp. UBA1131 TaxID=1947672 RepID=UPI0025EEBEE4|nr:hypothetical protein [Thalassospira sp. UBA1131]
MDAATFYWVIGGMGGTFLLIVGWVLKRQADDRADSTQSRAKQWDAHNELRRDHHGLERRMLEKMFTKDDATQMEKRITDVVRETVK